MSFILSTKLSTAVDLVMERNFLASKIRFSICSDLAVVVIWMCTSTKYEIGWIVNGQY